MSTHTLNPSSGARAKPHASHGHSHDNHGHEAHGNNTVFGLWIYLMSDVVLFGSLFATYVVLMNAYAGGPTGQEIFNLKFVLGETFVLLFSSITFGYASLAIHRGDKTNALRWLCVTFVLGALFIAMEIYEFQHLASIGAGPSRSAFLGAFYGLVGTHGLHVTAGLIWLAVLTHQTSMDGLTPRNQTRLACLGLFWHFLDLVWICVFTVVYLTGAL
ncbi:cytochrome o ubiquinol oxidase subunit III [Bordetella sp. J329]|nr:cytochrome o ubiquinol oxidase subunit III [Bordetella sp. J329]